MKYIFRLFKKLIIKIPEKIKDDFDFEIVRSNYAKLCIVSIILFIFQIIIFFSANHQIYNYRNEILYFLLINAVFLPIIFIIYHNLKNIKLLLAKTIINIYSVLILIFTIIISLKYQKFFDMSQFYMIAVITLVCFVYYKFINRIILFGIINVLFIILLPYYQIDNEICSMIITNSIIFNLLGFILSDLRLRSKLAAFINVKKLEELAQRDSMTGLYNHDIILLKLYNQMLNAKTNNEKLAFYMIDIDDFKYINDNFGHIKGDIIIKDTANVIKQNIKDTDILGRYGGDEFVIVSPHTDMQQAKTFVKQLKQKTKEMIIPVRISIGYGIYSHSESLDDFVKRIDKALYDDKKNKKKL